MNIQLKVKPISGPIPAPNTEEIIKTCKIYIRHNDLDMLKTYYANLQDPEILIISGIAYEYIYQKIFLYTCIIGSDEILKWLTETYFEFDDISKIALRQSFFYGKYLLKTYKHEIKWYDDFLNKVRAGSRPFLFKNEKIEKIEI